MVAGVEVAFCNVVKKREVPRLVAKGLTVELQCPCKVLFGEVEVTQGQVHLRVLVFGLLHYPKLHNDILEEHLGNVEFVRGTVHISQLEESLAIPWIGQSRLPEALECFGEAPSLFICSSDEQRVQTVAVLLTVEFLKEVNTFVAAEFRLQEVTEDKLKVAIYCCRLVSGLQQQSLALAFGSL